ncbi:hypothetical protein [Archangium sp.]|uniref:hypothetical protein n=1 Tax=Archangium sp. TaxID=1872627 RepID=UPI002D6C6CB7|nr:hypothetical protein [Archangium sp.]HYO59560.1 hypothetical protein [Archangium sp.]
MSAAFTGILVNQLREKNGRNNVLYRTYLRVSQTHDPEELGFHFGLIDTDSDEVTGVCLMNSTKACLADLSQKLMKRLSQVWSARTRSVMARARATS